MSIKCRQNMKWYMPEIIFPVIASVFIVFVILFISSKSYGSPTELRTQFWFESVQMDEKTKTAAIESRLKTKRTEVKAGYRYKDYYEHLIRREFAVWKVFAYTSEHREHLKKTDVQDYAAGLGFDLFKRWEFSFGANKREGYPVQSEWELSYFSSFIELGMKAWIRNNLQHRFDIQVHPLKNICLYYEAQYRDDFWQTWGIRAELRMVQDKITIPGVNK